MELGKAAIRRRHAVLTAAELILQKRFSGEQIRVCAQIHFNDPEDEDIFAHIDVLTPGPLERRQFLTNELARLVGHCGYAEDCQPCPNVQRLFVSDLVPDAGYVHFYLAVMEELEKRRDLHERLFHIDRQGGDRLVPLEVLPVTLQDGLRDREECLLVERRGVEHARLKDVWQVMKALKDFRPHPNHRRH